MDLHADRTLITRVSKLLALTTGICVSYVSMVSLRDVRLRGLVGRPPRLAAGLEELTKPLLSQKKYFRWNIDVIKGLRRRD